LNILTTSFILLSVTLSVTAQILLKHGMSSAAVQSGLKSTLYESVWVIFTNISVLLGLFAYVASAGVWLFVLSKVDVSKAYPFVGLGFVGTMLFAYWFLNEPLTLAKIVGTSLIVIGVFIVSR
jgi:multidrug transporter EmrE-like cation transporter